MNTEGMNPKGMNPDGMKDQSINKAPADGSGPADAALGKLLRRVGPRPLPPPGAEERIRAAVAAEWRGTVLRERRARRRQAAGWLAAAASVAVVAVAAWLVFPLGPAVPGPVMATVSRSEGPVHVRVADGWQALPAGGAIRAGDVVATGAGGRVALALADGLTLRMDQGSRLVATDPARVALEAGALYVDSGHRYSGQGDSGPAGNALVVATRFGETRHLGTLYQLRLKPDSLVVSVREGRVLTAPAGSAATVEAAAGEQLLLSRDGVARRGTVPTFGSDWAWIHTVTPDFAIENRSLAEFLAWAARETGRDLRFASAADQAAAEALVLRGSVAGLSPDSALDAVMATTAFDLQRTAAGQLVVQRAPEG